MRTIYVTLILMMSFSALAQTYELDKETSLFTWTGYGEVENFKQTGVISANKGDLTLQENDIKSGYVSIDMTSISHESKRLKKHLKAKDFFYAKKYPETIINFISLENDLIKCEIILRGKSGIICFPVTVSREEKQLNMRGTMTIDRTLYDIKYNSSSYFQDLGNYAIKNEIDVEFDIRFNLIEE